MNPDDASPPPAPKPAPPKPPIPWRIVGLALAAVGVIVGGGLWWNHHQDTQNAQSPEVPPLPPPSVVPEPPAHAAPRPAPPAPAPDAPRTSPAPLTPLTPLTPLESPPKPEAPAPASPQPESAPAPETDSPADRQARLEKYNQLRDRMKAEKEARGVGPSGDGAAAPLSPPPLGFPETVVAPSLALTSYVDLSRPAPLPPTAAGELKFTPGPLQAAREGTSVSFALPGVAAPAPAPAPPPEEDGGVPEGGPGLQSVDFGGVSDEAAPASRPPAPLPFALLSRVLPSPWDRDSELVFIGLQPVGAGQRERPRANLVFLVDDSISMGDPGKLPFLREAIGSFLDRLEPDDRVALVVYAGDSALLLPSTPVQGNKDAIRAAFAPARLAAVATGRPGASLQMAYDVARQNLVKGGFNRVIAVTDGDLNLGVGESGGLYDYVTRHARDGITLSILGLGSDFASGPKVRQLIRSGRGRASAARSVAAVGLALDKEIALPPPESVRDLRFALPLGPDRAAWRLVGYQNRLAGASPGGFLAVYEVRRKEAPAPAPPEMSLRFRRESAAADEILAQSLDSGPPPGLDPRVWSSFSASVGEVQKRVASLPADGSAADSR